MQRRKKILSNMLYLSHKNKDFTQNQGYNHNTNKLND